MKAIALSLLLAGTALAQAADLPYAKERIVWNKPFEPFHVIGNIYYVGMADVSAFLIVTPKGDILTDGGLPESASFVEQHIKALGFKLSDVKILLNSHAHFDHAGGLAKLKADTGAKLYASADDKPVLERGHIGFGLASQVDFPPVKVDHVVADGDTVSLGGATLTAHITPGHTKGCTTWTMPVTDGEATRKVMFFCSITVGGNPLNGSSAHPGIAEDYKYSFTKLAKMDADVFLAPHGDQFGLDEKVTKLKAGGANPFVDAAEFHRRMAKFEADFDKELAKQTGDKGGK